MNKFFLSATLIATLVVLIACTDKDYDLSDVDTTARITVKDLVVPINLNDITLDEMLDLSDTSKVKINSDSTEYAIIEDGTFSSNDIEIETFTTPATSTEKSAEIFISPASASHTAKEALKTTGNLIASADIPTVATSITASTDNIDTSIIGIDKVGTELTIRLSLKFEGLTNVINTIDIEGVKIQFIKGLKATLSDGSYDSVTGIIDLGNIKTTTSHTYELTINITEIEAEKAGITLKNGKFDLSASANVISGHIAIYQLKEGASLPTSAKYDITANIGTCKVTKFTGTINYGITGINVSSIDLKGIPDILSQTGTNIKLGNPQIYLNLNNPLRQEGYELNAQAGLRITGNTAYSTTNDAIVLDQQDNLFILSPTNPKTRQAGYESAEHISFADLSNVVSGEQGLPKSISIDVLSPMIPTQEVTDFKLGTKLNSVNGKWSFYAPLSLTTDSKIKYSKTWDTWQDEDLDYLTVQNGTVTATMSSDIPLGLNVTITMLGREGNLSGTTSLAANAQNVEITIPLTGTAVSKIYGATIDARISGNGTALSPTQKIIVKNLKVKVNGYYEKEL